MMMITADATCGWRGDQGPKGYKPISPALSSQHSPQHPRPLRHGIDAILHKTSPSSSLQWPPKPTLPHIETLRRPPASGIPTSLLSVPASALNVQRARCVMPFEDGEESRGDPSSRSSVDSSEEQEDIVVVDDSSDSVCPEGDSSEEHSQNPERKESQSSEQHFQEGSLPQDGLTPPHLSPQNENFLPACSAFRANADLNANITPPGSLENVKSAFRPIVRPWLFENGSQPCSQDLMAKATACRDHFGTIATLPTKAAESGLRSLDAISTLRKQSSVFRVACNTNRPQVHKNHVMMALISPAMDNGQPLPSSLTSWFSWLRAGGMHFGAHPSSQQFTPGAPPPCRSVLPPSGVPGPPPPQAPRYNCEACGKSYSTFGGLSKHKQFHCAAQIKKDFRCKFCDKSYSSLGALKMHIRTHTLPCKCTVCGKAFSRPWLLQGHLRTHTGEKPFSCPHCARAFADRSNLRAHLQTHSDVKKYSCRHCSKTFSRMSLLAKHRESCCMALHS